MVSWNEWELKIILILWKFYILNYIYNEIINFKFVVLFCDRYMYNYVYRKIYVVMIDEE